MIYFLTDTPSSPPPGQPTGERAGQGLGPAAKMARIENQEDKTGGGGGGGISMGVQGSVEDAYLNFLDEINELQE